MFDAAEIASFSLLTQVTFFCSPHGVKQILEKITAQRALEAKWLHTLSLLEHIGARKISKSMGSGHPDDDLLKHLADEARHAHAFKKLACHLSGRSDPEYLCANEAVHYFQTLDSRLSEWIQTHGTDNPSQASYLLVTAVIEKRAMKLYPLYRSLTHESLVRDELQQIILEEADHKPGIEDAAEAYLKSVGQNFDFVSSLEENLYSEFESALNQAI